MDKKDHGEGEPKESEENGEDESQGWSIRRGPKLRVGFGSESDDGWVFGERETSM